jgi:hypothetical protein
MPADLASLRDAGRMRFDPSGRLVAFVYASGALDDATDAVRAAGGNVERSSAEIGAIQAALPLRTLRDIASDPTVRYVGLPRYPVLNPGTRTTQGDELLNADDVRAVFGVDGSGVKVGVISDGLWEFEESQASGDLPASVDYTTCNAVPSFDPTSPLAGGEGTAMLEIVHDLAPGAELWFASFGLRSPSHGTEMDFMAAVSCLAERVDVVVDDISWFGAGPYDGSSAVSMNTTNALNGASNPIRMYTTSVGNWARSHYAGPFEPCQGGEMQTFQATAQTLDAHGLGPRCSNPIIVGPFSSALVSLVWDDPFGASCNDYDLLLLEHDSANAIASSANPQTCAQDPVEEIAFTNATTSSVTWDVAVRNVGGLAEARDLDMFIIASDLSYYTPAGSVPNQGDAAGGVISVGAIAASDLGVDDIQPYSSNGPTEDGRTKPEITAVDCVRVTGNGFTSPFCGTSAAAPHIAGIAALLLDCDPSLLAMGPDGSAAESRALLSSALLETAADRGLPGADNVYGAGLVDAMAAANALCPPPGLLGDVDCNTTVNAVDALLILREVAQLPPPAACIYLGDVDCDLALDAVDALGVLRYVAGIPLAPPPGCRAIGS